MAADLLVAPAGSLHAAPADPRRARPAGPPRGAIAGEDQKVHIEVEKKNKKADDKKKKKENEKEKEKKPQKGWFPKLSLGASTSLAHTHQVPGVQDGLSLTIGGVLNSELKFLHHAHSWTTSLSIVHSWSKTPTIDPFFKSADEAELKSIYAYRFESAKKLSVFGGVQLTAPIAPGSLVVAQDTDLLFTYTDDTEVPDVAVGNRRYRLTRAFSPLIFKQLAGAGVTPWDKDLATLVVKLALAGQQVWADGWAVQDDKATPELELIQLRNFQQFGLQLETELTGKLKKRLIYGFRLELMYPFWTSVDTDLSGFDLLNTDLSFKLGVKVGKWASLEYVFSAKRIPLIVDQWQLVNNLVLTLTANIL